MHQIWIWSWISIHITTGQCLRNKRMPSLLMERKVFSLQRAQLCRHHKIRAKWRCGRLVHFFQNLFSATQNAFQYLVWPPRACMHAWQRRGMLLMRRRMMSCGISSQICVRASLSCCTVWGATWRRLMDRNIMSQRCSIGFKSGDREGHSIVSIPSSSTYCLHTLATWGPVLSCIRRKPGPTAPA